MNKELVLRFWLGVSILANVGMLGMVAYLMGR